MIMTVTMTMIVAVFMVNMKLFHIIFRDDKNYELEKLLRNTGNNLSTIITENKESNLICKKIKFCIKTVLKGLNLLNNKDFSHLNKAVSYILFAME